MSPKRFSGRRHGTVVVLVALAGCVDAEPAPSPACPAGSRPSFVRTGLKGTDVWRDPAIVIGGTLNVSLACMGFPKSVLPFARPFAAHVDGDAITVSVSDPDLAIVGVHAGTSTIDITSPDGTEHYRSLGVTTAAIDRLVIEATHYKVPMGREIVFATERASRIHAKLVSADAQELIDDSATFMFPPGASLHDLGFELHDGAFNYEAVPPGEHTIQVSSVGMTYTAPFVVVDHADAIELDDPTVSIARVGQNSVCFNATNAGRFVAGLIWSFSVEGVYWQPIGTHCLGLMASYDYNGDGSVPIRATAGGQSVQVSIPVLQTR